MKCLSTRATHLNYNCMDAGGRAITDDCMNRYFAPLATTPCAAPNRRSRAMQEQRSGVPNKDWNQL